MAEEYCTASVGEAIRLFRSTDMMHKKRFEQIATDCFGIHRSQHMTLMYVSKNPNISQKRIADEFKISAAAVAVTLKKLESAGLIVRDISDGDNRKNKINITEKGQNVVNETHKLFSAIDRHMVDGLSESEIAVFRHCLKVMQKNLCDMAQLLPDELN